MKWTAEQQDAIESDQPTLLVSAAAGSGKTAVLVARVMRMLRQGQDITRMLIVTFTRAAAAEMRQRIADAIENEAADPHLYLQQRRLSRAPISTLHTFCQTVIRRHFEIIGIDPLARIGDDATLTRMRNTATEEAMEAAYGEPTEEQEYLFDCYSPEDVMTMAERTRQFLMSMPDPWEWAEKAGQGYEGPLEGHPLFPLMMRTAEDRLREAGAILDRCEALLFDPRTPERFSKALEADRALLETYLDLARRGQLRGGTVKFSVIPRAKKTDVDDEEGRQRYLALREQFKEQMKAAVDPLPRDDRLAVEDDNQASAMVRGLFALAREIHERYQALKAKRDLLDYNDLEHFCLRLLREPRVAEEMSQAYDALFIDEYQDVSPIQEEIIQALHKGNRLFLVGDVKQSIYRFRQADPGLFMDKYARYPLTSGAEERKILLQNNFRSARNVLESVNLVFSNIMRRESLEIEYDDAAALKPGPDAPEGPETELRLLISSDAETGEEKRVTESAAWEARCIVERIKDLMRERDPAMPTRSRYHYRDIVILLRNAAGRAQIYAEALQQAGIPVYADTDAQYYDLREIQDVMNILRVVDNPYQDLPLLAVCRIPYFGFTPEELAAVRIRDTSPKTPYHQVFFAWAAQPDTPLGEKAAALVRCFDRWRFLSRHLRLEEFVRLLMDESGIYYAAGTAEDGLSRQANLRLLCEKAEESGTLFDFLERTDLRATTDDSRTAKSLSDQEDVVRIMTMHKSKGLEFPVVILGGLSRRFRAVDTDQPMLDRELGAAVSMIDPEKRLLRHTLTEAVMTDQLTRKAKAEEARILYVAMTRAKERLILYGAPPFFHTALEQWKSLRGPQAGLGAGCMLDWIVPSLGLDAPEGDQRLTAENGSRWRVILEDISGMADGEEKAPIRWPEPETGEISPWLRQMLEREMPEGRPMKIAVSALNRFPVTEEDQEETPQKKRRASFENDQRLPRFMQEHVMTPAERGSAVHKALGLISYSALREELTLEHIAALLDELRAGQRLTAQERQVISAEEMLRFFRSSLGQRALNSPAVRREWSFDYAAGPEAYLQGVIDLCFQENGQWVLVDYKTDAVSRAEELLPRYTNQLSWYRRALEELTGIPVRETCLYSVTLGEQVIVPE